MLHFVFELRVRELSAEVIQSLQFSPAQGHVRTHAALNIFPYGLVGSYGIGTIEYKTIEVPLFCVTKIECLTGHPALTPAAKNHAEYNAADELYHSKRQELTWEMFNFKDPT